MIIVPSTRISFVWPTVVTSGGGGALPSGDIFAETFEGSNSGYDLTGWYEDLRAGCTINPDYTSNPSPQGGDSLLLIGVDDTVTINRDMGTQTELWGRFLIRLHSTASSYIFRLYASGSGNDVNLIVSINGDQTWYIRDGQNNRDNSSVNSMALDTWYYVWWHWKAGPGGNAISELAFSTTTTRPAYTSNDAVQVTNGTSYGADNFMLGDIVGNLNCQFDDVNVFSSAF